MAPLRSPWPPMLLLLLLSALAMPAVAEEQEEGGGREESALGLTMIGGIFFVMGLFHLTHWKDGDIRKISWNIISDTISIFCAVTLFSSVSELFEIFLSGAERAADVKTQLLLNRCWVAFWYVVLVGALAWSAGLGRGARWRQEQVLRSKHALWATKSRLRCCRLFAHATGFAGIAGWAVRQNEPWYRASVWHCAMLVPESMLWYYIIIKLLQLARSWFVEKSSLLERCEKDGRMEVDELVRFWVEQVEDGENDFFGLFVSSLIVNTLRFGVGGTLPNSEGEEGEAKFNHTTFQSLSMVFIALGLLLSAYKVLQVKRSFEKHEKHKAYLAPSRHVWVRVRDLCGDKVLGALAGYFGSSPDQALEYLVEAGAHTIERAGIIVINIVTMSFAWCVLYGTQWLLAPNYLGQELVLGIVLAIVISVLGALLIWVLDELADDADLENKEEREQEEVIRKLMESVGILVGFAWEQCFDTSLEGVAGEHDRMLKPFLGLCTVLFIVPVWYMYIVPMEIEQGHILGFTPNKVKDRMQQIFADGRPQMRLEVYSSLKEALTGMADVDKSPEGENLEWHVRQWLEERESSRAMGYRPPEDLATEVDVRKVMGEED